MEEFSFIGKKMKLLGLMLNIDRLLADFKISKIEHRLDAKLSIVAAVNKTFSS